MMRLSQLAKIISLSLLSFSVLGCQPKHSSYLYLLRHPDFLQEQMANCQTTQSSVCETVKKAADDYLAMNNQREENPEAFGLKILDAQRDLVDKKTALDAVKQNLSDPAEQKKLPVLQEAYDAELLTVNAMLAIVASTSPE